jgi:hypothetical protein
MTMTREAIRWRKSSISDAQDTCVELAHTGEAVRDSKNPTGPTLTVGTHDLLATIKTGRLAR